MIPPATGWTPRPFCAILWAMEKLGTFDFYFDVADKLRALGVEFVVMVRPPGVKTILNYSNVRDVVTAEKMSESLEIGFRERFGPPDGEDDVSPNPGSDPAP